jgi:hypothetical protein
VGFNKPNKTIIVLHHGMHVLCITIKRRIKMIDPDRQNMTLNPNEGIGLFEGAFIGSVILNILCLGFLFGKWRK